MKIRYGMIGGDLDAFIGEIHRKAINFINDTELVCGCFSRNKEKNSKTGNHYRLDSKRVYADYETMAKLEKDKEEKPDFIVITTPNNTHYDIAKTFLNYGFNIVCEKPLCFTIEEANELERIAKEKNLMFAVMYTYIGYSMVKYMKKLIADGKIGDIVNVQAEYAQDWLTSAINDEIEGPSLSIWRMDPTYTGLTNAIGDIGTHIEATVKYVTGLKIERLLSKIDRFNYNLDLNANMLVEYDNGATGSYWCSQVSLGHPNGFKIRVYGTKGSLTWFQETPDYLVYADEKGIISQFTRGANYVYGNSKVLNKTPKGHPEGYHEAFANIYKTFITTLKKRRNNEELIEDDFDYPDVSYGKEGVEFIHRCIESDKDSSSWK